MRQVIRPDEVVACRGKIPFATKMEAQAGVVHLKKVWGEKCHVYFCRHCRYFHYGHNASDHRDNRYRRLIKDIIRVQDEDDDDEL